MKRSSSTIFSGANETSILFHRHTSESWKTPPGRGLTFPRLRNSIFHFRGNREKERKRGAKNYVARKNVARFARLSVWPPASFTWNSQARFLSEDCSRLTLYVNKVNFWKWTGNARKMLTIYRVSLWTGIQGLCPSLNVSADVEGISVARKFRKFFGLDAKIN